MGAQVSKAANTPAASAVPEETTRTEEEELEYSAATGRQLEGEEE